jgi:hypothetical protein
MGSQPPPAQVQSSKPTQQPDPQTIQPPPAAAQPDLNSTQIILDATANIAIFGEDDRGGAVTVTEAQALVDENRNSSVNTMRVEEGQPAIILNRIRRTWDHIGRENRDFGYAYDTFATRGQDWTIGYGHHDSFINRNIREDVLELLTGIDDGRGTDREPLRWDSIRSGRQALTTDQLDTLFQFDYDRKERAVQNSVGAAWDTLPQWVRSAAVNGMFRGDLGPDTRAHMRNNNWGPDESGMNAVAREYANHGNWDDGGGVAARMRRNQRRFLIYGLYQRRLQELTRVNP